MKINDKSQSYIVLAVIIFAFYYLIIKPAKKGVTDILGITDSEDKKEVEREINNKNGPFTKELWHDYFYMPPAPANNRKKISGVLQLSMPKMIIELHKKFGILSDNEKGVFTFFAKFKTQCEVSFFSEFFYKQYNIDILYYLRNGVDFLPENGLSDSALNKIIKAINKLPIR